MIKKESKMDPKLEPQNKQKERRNAISAAAGNESTLNPIAPPFQWDAGSFQSQVPIHSSQAPEDWNIPAVAVGAAMKPHSVLEGHETPTKASGKQRHIQQRTHYPGWMTPPRFNVPPMPLRSAVSTSALKSRECDKLDFISHRNVTDFGQKEVRVPDVLVVPNVGAQKILQNNNKSTSDLRSVGRGQHPTYLAPSTRNAPGISVHRAGSHPNDSLLGMPSGGLTTGNGNLMQIGPRNDVAQYIFHLQSKPQTEVQHQSKINLTRELIETKISNGQYSFLWKNSRKHSRVGRFRLADHADIPTLTKLAHEAFNLDPAEGPEPHNRIRRIDWFEKFTDILNPPREDIVVFMLELETANPRIPWERPAHDYSPMGLCIVHLNGLDILGGNMLPSELQKALIPRQPTDPASKCYLNAPVEIVTLRGEFGSDFRNGRDDNPFGVGFQPCKGTTLSVATGVGIHLITMKLSNSAVQGSTVTAKNAGINYQYSITTSEMPFISTYCIEQGFFGNNLGSFMMDLVKQVLEVGCETMAGPVNNWGLDFYHVFLVEDLFHKYGRDSARVLVCHNVRLYY